MILKWLQNWLYPPHTCHDFYYYSSRGIKECRKCGLQFFICDDRPVNEPRPTDRKDNGNS